MLVVGGCAWHNGQDSIDQQRASACVHEVCLRASLNKR